MLRLSFNLWIVSLAILGVPRPTGGTERWSQGSSFPKFSSQIPSSSSANRRVSPAKASYDYSGGFPQGFAQGLPTFDFTGPMPSADEQKEQHQAASETENVGFVHGPPDGFPTLEQLGGKFPNFGEGNLEHSPSKNHDYHYQPSPQAASSSSPEYSREEEDEDYLSGPGPSSVDNPVQRMPTGGHGIGSRPPSPSQYRRQQSGTGPQAHLYPSAQASGSNSHSKYPGPSPYGYKPKKPVLLKISGKRNRPGSEGLPPGPPVFYAPSPDMQSSSQQPQDSVRSNKYEIHPRSGNPSYNNNYNNHRYRRSSTDLKNTSASQTVTEKKQEETKYGADDLKTAASDTDTYWELTSSPFIMFDTYKKAESETPSSSNITFIDTDGGEQRFFPSFPGPAPYLAGPFGGGPGGPPSRPPLFPGPAANRAPSRYHPQYSGPKFSPPPPPPNRGPSNVYSAESHDHYQDNNLLGSGNFEVVRGGTYYGDDDDGYHGGGGGGGGNAGYHDHDDDYYHHNHNGHSSPQEGYRVPGQDFFANFRDFADINPPSRSFSHRHEALAAEPRETISIPSQSRAPKNILDKLESSSDNNSKVRQSAMSRESDPMMATF